MENFSTPRQPLVPRVANLATLLVVVAAIGWSNGQRPDSPAAGLALAAAAPQGKPAQASATPVVAADEVQAPHATLAVWPAQVSTQAGALGREGLQAVGYTATISRR